MEIPAAIDVAVETLPEVVVVTQTLPEVVVVTPNVT